MVHEYHGDKDPKIDTGDHQEEEEDCCGMLHSISPQSWPPSHLYERGKNRQRIHTLNMTHLVFLVYGRQTDIPWSGISPNHIVRVHVMESPPEFLSMCSRVLSCLSDTLVVSFHSP